MTLAIETQDLVKEYTQGSQLLRILKKVNLKIEKGEFMAIMGPSGSGKSTLLNMLGALDRPTSGKVMINGTDISTLDDNQLADLRNKEIGFIFQQFNLIQRMDAQHNVELPLSISGVPTKLRKEKAKALLESVGLGERTDHRPNQLSGGEQQRVAIARALANNPPLFLCDELTGNLDSKTGQEIMGLLRRLNQEQGKTFVLITHDPNVAQATDRLLMIRDGEIAGEKKFK
ncbi:TPA: ABC transporter ATP-binding protein [Candidatus Bathyarchaeota archaeon]|nr:ABC transporter ATP-binding protein [Candidatus Bathyarchaeota archaeon]